MRLIVLVFAIAMNVSAFTQSLSRFGVDSTRTVPTGLATGAYAPMFNATDTEGNAVDLKESLQEGPVVLMFFRGAWCGHCNRYMHRVQDSLEMITAHGARVIAITPELLEGAKESKEKFEVNFNVISDADGKISEDYEVSFFVTKKYQKKVKTLLRKNLKARNGQEEAKLPVPATYIISPSGKIVWRHFNLDYRDRAAVKDIVAELEKMKK